MYIADLHIHSRYSRATSRDCAPETLDLWARRKGIHIVGTGDFTHPAWREELEEKLEPAEEGLYKLKKEYCRDEALELGAADPRFVITGEISSIYKKNGRVRKVHNLILLPGLEEAQKAAKKLEAIGNIHSDGRPILGLDCRDLLEILMELCEETILVPAHIWTPHFSLFGAFSGFDTVEECFEDMTPYIHAMETGLSSDPPMNWRVSALDKYQLISNSDAHSPAKLGREATLLSIDLSYQGLRAAIQEGKGLAGTLEFFPEEGKYHFDGHRKCSLCLKPLETEGYQGICPVCGKKITIGVSHRVEQMADREEGYQKPEAAGFESLMPLPEVIGEALAHSPASVKVQKEYLHMLHRLGPEFDILRHIPLEEIRRVSGTMVAEGIGRLRQGKVERLPGFDGEYGKIKLFYADELHQTDGQLNLFETVRPGRETAGNTNGNTEERAEGSAAEGDGKGAVEATRQKADKNLISQAKKPEAVSAAVKLNAEQKEAVEAADRIIAVVAGPGTGKTKTLVSHIAFLIENRKVKLSEITAVTFTNQAAAEMKERLQVQLGKRKQLNKMQIGTFHSLCLAFLKETKEDVSLLDEVEAMEIAREIKAEYKLRETPSRFLEKVSRLKCAWGAGAAAQSEESKTGGFKTEDAAVLAYQDRLSAGHLLDFDDLLIQTLKEIRKGSYPAAEKKFSYLLVDEFQDISPLQYELIRAWNQNGRELFVIGDPDQSIYGFRGADASCFMRLETDDPQLRKITLQENYRSAPPVVKAAVSVISQNPGPERKLEPNRNGKLPVRIVRAGSEMGEAIFIAKEINRLTGGIGMLEAQEIIQGERETVSFDDIAVLCRTHRQADLVEKCLKQESIPYVAAGRESFLQEDTVRASIAFFRCLESVENITPTENDPSAKNNPPLEHSPDAARSKALCMKLLWNLEENVVSEGVFTSLLEKYRPFYRKKKPQKFLELWMEEMHLTDDVPMKKLADMTLFYQSMPQFTTALALGVESDLKRCGSRSYAAGAVTLMTLHGAKGLEFPVAFLFGARKGTMPFESEKHPADTEEERRLFFVGMTRARDELILTTSGDESEFLADIPETVSVREKADKRKYADSGKQLSLFDFM